MSVWLTVGPLDGLEARDILAFEKGMLSMAVFVADGRPYALESRCLHAGESLLDGAVDGWTVIGPWHGAGFDLGTGAVLEPPALEPLRYYPDPRRLGRDGDRLSRNR